MIGLFVEGKLENSSNLIIESSNHLIIHGEESNAAEFGGGAGFLLVRFEEVLTQV